MKVDVYTRTVCQQCKMTKRKLDDLNIHYNVINIDEDAEARLFLQTLGYQTVPIVIVEGREPILGFRPNELEKLKGGK